MADTEQGSDDHERPCPSPDLFLPPPARFCFSLMGRALQLVLLYDDDGAFNNSLQIASFGVELEFTAT